MLPIILRIARGKKCGSVSEDFRLENPFLPCFRWLGRLGFGRLWRDGTFGGLGSNLGRLLLLGESMLLAEIGRQRIKNPRYPLEQWWRPK